jgi:CelD/BcsL family acetyltransferase involved in cellulose biosynthesis
LSSVRTRLLAGFDDPSFGRDDWNRLVLASPTPSPYLTWEFQRAWQDAGMIDGETLLVAAEREDKVVAVAPLHVVSGEVSFSGSCFEYERMDFLGAADDLDVLTALIDAALAPAGDEGYFDLEFVHDGSPTNDLLPQVAERLGLSAEVQYEMIGLGIDLLAEPDLVHKDTLRNERWLARRGQLDVNHFRDPAEIAPRLGVLFDLHRRRWPGPENPSRFFQPEVCRLFECLVERCAGTDLLRFTQIDWDGRPIACHFGSSLAGRFFFRATAFEPAIEQRGPGAILLRHVIHQAVDEDARFFEFGTGGQPFKRRYANVTWPVLSWLVEPPDGA